MKRLMNYELRLVSTLIVLVFLVATDASNLLYIEYRIFNSRDNMQILILLNYCTSVFETVNARGWAIDITNDSILCIVALILSDVKHVYWLWTVAALT